MAEVDGRPVVVSGDDFTVRGGSSEATIPAKRHFAEQIAIELGLPHIRLVDGMGGGGSVKSIEIKGRTLVPQISGWETVVNHLAVAPSVALALGSVAGIGAARVATSHYSVIVAETAQMMIAGPALVDQASLGDVRRRSWATPASTPPTARSTTWSPPRTRRSSGPGGSCPTCPPNVDELPPRRPPRRPRPSRRACSPRSCPATRAGSTRCAR